MSERTAAIDVGAANLQFARGLIGTLWASGVAAAFVSPGSRSTPLAVAIAGQPGLPHFVFVDERSAAFHALGYAKASGRPVVLLCTSGTAGANFLPAVAEACHARVPLIVLTADRPPELRAWGAAQTMEQRTLYAGFTRWSEETPCPSERPAEIAYARALGRRAIVEATGPAPGPVHLNLPFREPLLPASIDAVELPVSETAATSMAERSGPINDLDDLAREMQAVARGVLVFGPDAFDASLGTAAHGLATALGWPVLADPASGLRAGAPLDESLVTGADLLLRDAKVATELRPDLVVRFGGPPTSKAINEWIARHASTDVWLVDAADGFRDPQHRATRSIRATARQFCAVTASSIAGSATVDARRWNALWRRADEIARSALAEALAGESRFLSPHLAQALWSALPENAALYVANSMPIRDIDAFAGPRRSSLRVLGNRGVNGIDGLVSAALGASTALRRPTVLWCGDLALLHDVSGLLAGRMQGADLTIVVSNDDGGGIFEYLPAARTLPRPLFEEMFAVPHGLDLCAVARGFGWEATRAASADALGRALSNAIGGGRQLVEVPVDRGDNTAFHVALHSAVSARLQREFGS